MRIRAMVLAASLACTPFVASADPIADGRPNPADWPRKFLSRLLDGDGLLGSLETWRTLSLRDNQATRQSTTSRDMATTSFALPARTGDQQKPALRFATGENYRVLFEQSKSVSLVMGSSAADRTAYSADRAQDEDRLRAGINVNGKDAMGFYGVSIGRDSEDLQPSKGLRGLLQLEFRF